MKRISGLMILTALAVLSCGGREESGSSEQEAPRLTGDALASALQDANVLLLDVRNPDELEELGTVEGYINIPIDELAERLDELPRDKPILTA